MLRTGVVVVRRTTRVSASSSSIASVVSETANCDGLPGVAAAQGDLLPADHDDAGGAGAALDPDGLHRRPWRWPGWPGAAQAAGLFAGQRVGPGAQQDPGLGIVEHQRVFLDADADQLAAEDLRGEEPVGAEADQAAAGDRALNLQGLAVFRRGSGAGPAGTPPLAASLARSLTDRCERRVLIRAPRRTGG